MVVFRIVEVWRCVMESVVYVRSVVTDGRRVPDMIYASGIR